MPGETNKKQPQNPPEVKQPHKAEEPQEQKQQLQEKQLRRVAERGEMPTEKGELIQYLSSRIRQAEEALADTQELLEVEVKEREKVEKALDERNSQLSKLYEVDQRALPEKIKEKLNQILTTTVTQKIEAEEKLLEEKNRNYEYKARYEEIKWEDNQNKAKLEEQEGKEKALCSELEVFETQNKASEQEIEQLTTELTELREKKDALEQKYLQMRVALDRMGDIKGVLNRFFSNEDLFDEGMNLKQQKVVRPPQPVKESALPPSRNLSRQGAQNQKLKPISRLKNDDEDFWRADFKS